MLVYASCHCQAVKIEMETDAPVTAYRCNCSICDKSGFLHLIASAASFKLLKGEDNLACYTFNTGVAKHYFCKTCGMRPFYIPRSNPDGFSVNARCLDPIPDDLIIKPFDGRNWEDNAHALQHLGQEDNPGD